MEFDWNEDKARINFRKHGVRIPEAIPAFEDVRAITVGMGAIGRLLVVVFTWRGENIRIISVRAAEPHEVEDYEEEQ